MIDTAVWQFKSLEEVAEKMYVHAQLSSSTVTQEALTH